jgi:ankyrin repeat protein
MRQPKRKLHDLEVDQQMRRGPRTPFFFRPANPTVRAKSTVARRRRKVRWFSGGPTRDARLGSKRVLGRLGFSAQGSTGASGFSRLAGILAWLLVLVVLHAGRSGAEENRMDLLEAVRLGDDHEVLRLIDSGADLEVRDDEQRTPLMIAVRLDHRAVAHVLIESGADVNAKDAIGDTPFLYAGAEGRNEILRAILASGRAALGDTNRYGGTALIPAAHHGHPETVRKLLGAGIDVDHVNRLGWTALLEAVILGDGGPVYREIVGLLVDAGASNIPDRQGKTPLDHAQARGFQEIAARIAAGPQR